MRLRLGVETFLFAMHLFIILVCHFTMRSSDKPRLNRIFSVTVPQHAQNHPQIQQISARFKKQMNQLCGIFLVLSVPFLFSYRYMSLYIMAYLIFIFGYLLLLYLPYKTANQGMRALKAREGWQSAMENVVYVDTKASAAKRANRISYADFFFPAVISALSFIPYAQTEDAHILYPVGFKLFLVAISIGAPLLLYAAAKRMPNKVYSTDSNINIECNAYRKSLYCHTAFLAAILDSIIEFLTTLLLLRKMPIALYFTAVAICSFVLLGYILIRFKGMQTLYRSAIQNSDLLPPTSYDADDCWKWGLFYYNPQDSRSLLEQPYGMSLSFNYARPAAKIICGITFAIVAGMFIFLGFLIADECLPPNFSFDTDASIVSVDTPMYQLAIPLSEVTAIELADTKTLFAQASKIYGYGTSYLARGTYAVPGLGYTNTLVNKEISNLILLRSDNEVWLFNHQDETETAEIYAQLQQFIQSTKHQ